MPSHKNRRVTTAQAIQELELYKETLALEHNLGKQTVSPRHEYGTCPFGIDARFRKIVSLYDAL